MTQTTLLRASPAFRRRHSSWLNLSRDGWALVMCWPLISLFLAGVLWSMTNNKLEADKLTALAEATRNASALSKSYSALMVRSVEKIDEITKIVKRDWEVAGGSLDLATVSEYGLFNKEHFSMVFITDRHGDVVASTVNKHQNMNVRGQPLLDFHRDNPSKELRISKAVIGRLTGTPIVHFSRRLETADGAFNGVVVVAIRPNFFEPFAEDALIGKASILALVDEKGLPLVTTFGGKASPPDAELFKAPLSTNTVGAVKLTGGNVFADGEPRYVVTAPLGSYSYSIVAGLSEAEQMHGFLSTRKSMLRFAIAGSIILTFFALAAMYLSARLVMRKAMMENIRASYRVATEGGNEGFYMWRVIRGKGGMIVDFEMVDCNERGASMYGMDKQELLGKKLGDLYSGEHADKLVATFVEAFEAGFVESEVQVPDFSLIKADWLYRKMVRTQEGLAVTFRDITEHKLNEKEMQRLATEDALTGLPNRYWLTKALPQLLVDARDNQTKLAVLFIDLDDFKNVNDTHGHSAGDELLKAAAARLRSVVRPGDKVARLGGDEFTIILNPVHDDEDVKTVALRIVKAFREPFELAQGKNSVGTSIGIGMYPRDGLDSETLLKNADIAMYSAKETKGNYCFYDNQLFDKLKHRVMLEQELQKAIAEDQFVIHYQPRVDTRSGKIVGMEALVRWQHPVRGLVPPAEFIPLAEASDIILDLGALVMRKVSAQIAEWRQAGKPVVPVSINVSARQFNKGQVKHLVHSCLSQYSLPPELLEIELTESTMMSEDDDILVELAELEALGVNLHVDDFGTGYSSMALLQRLKLDVLKVDRAFTSKLDGSRENEIFFKAIVSMAHALGMSVIAEGVETSAQLRVLQKLGCDEVQGFLMSKPVGAAEVQALMEVSTLFQEHPDSPLSGTEP